MPNPLSCINAIVTSTPAEETETGCPVFTSIQQALDAAPDCNTSPWVILVRSGLYREKLLINKRFITLKGEGADTTTLSFDAFSGQQKPDGSGPWGTFGCASLTIKAPDFTAADLKISNDFDFLSNDSKAETDPSRLRDSQAVAIMTDAGSDRTMFQNVDVCGYQDTLFVNAGRTCFIGSRISGNVDFIFGAGQALFDSCQIVTRPRTKPGVNPVGYVTAPSTSITQAWGLVFLNCQLLREGPDVPDHACALGRPWHPTTTFPDGRYADPDAIGSTVFIECFMDSHITHEGWASMSGTPRSGTEKVWFRPEDSRFFEYASTGPGASHHPLRRQLGPDEAARFSRPALLGDWRI